MRSMPSKLTGLSALVLFLLACVPGSIAQTASKLSPGEPITISVDATEAPRKLLHARLTIPAKPGPLTLFYPKWLPGEHGPTGPILNLVGLRFFAGGKEIPWQRDNLDMFTFRCNVPAGAAAVEVTLDFLSPMSTVGFSSGASATDRLVDLSWNHLLLYPAGRPTDAVPFIARLRLPPGWKFGTALPVATEGKDEIVFKPVSLTTLVDSPVIASAHFRSVPLASSASSAEPVQLDIAADSEAALAIRPETIKAYQALVTEASALFHARHYRSYRFLLSLSDRIASFGLEHHESSDNRAGERTLIDDGRRKVFGSLLPHEFVHSWNGKYRRPAGLATADFQQPMKDDLLWVYEGLTEYLGAVLAARSGLWTEADYREQLALTAAAMDVASPGRTWRPLIDTTVAAQILYEGTEEWNASRRSVDFYPEGQLLWLEVDTLIRQKSGGTRSIDDFCQRFHGGASSAPMVKPYTFDDVVTTLNDVAAHDWRGFWTSRLSSTSPRAPLGGVTGGGYTLVYKETPSDYSRAVEQLKKGLDLSYSLGLSLREDGAIVDVIPGLPAATAGMGPGMRLLAINGRRFTADLLRDALAGAKASSAPIELIAENGDFFRTYRVDYHGGERYPHLERDPRKPDLLSAIIKPKSASLRP
jgi:predicted metalloprotease with PDZ domain